MAKKKKNIEDNMEIYTAALQREFEQWDVYYNYGGADPFHEDGVNLTLIRNHIIYYKRKIEEEINNNSGQISFTEKKYPDIYFKETPPEVDYKYMAVPNRILDTGINFVRKLEENPTFQFILKHVDEVFPKQRETEVSKALGIPFIPTMQLTHYHDLVESGKLVDIRRTFYKKDFDKFIAELEDTAKKFEKFLALTPEEIEQMSVKKKRHSTEKENEDLLEDADAYIADKPSINEMIHSASSKVINNNENILEVSENERA